MEPVAIATVVAVSGKAYARNADGELREIRPGDVLLEGETVVTPEGATVELSLSDGSPLLVADMPELTLSPDLVAETAPGADESAVQDETIDAVLAALESGEDLGDVLDATAAGPGGAGPAGAGHSFIRLGRIAEEVSEFSGIAGSSGTESEGVVDENVAPVDAIDDSATTNEGEPVTIAIERNDLFVEGEDVVSITQPANGLAILNDDDTVTYTPNEGFSGTDTFSYTATNPDGSQGDTALVTVTVVADPEPPAPELPVINIGDDVVVEGATAEVTIALDKTWSEDVQVDFITSDGTAVASVDGGDYDEKSGMVTIPAGSSSVVVTFVTNEDNLREPTEFFNVTLNNAVNAVIGDGDGIVEIIDIYEEPTISIGDQTVVEGQTAEVTVSLSRAVEESVSVDFVSADGTAIEVNGDYLGTSGTLTFAPGQTELLINVVTLDDAIEESTENMLLNLSNASNAVIADAQGVVTIIDNDEPDTPPPPPPPPPPPVEPEISINDVTVSEGSVATLTVSLSQATTQQVSVSFATADGTATVSGADYDPDSGTLTFAPGTTSATVSIQTNVDLLQEGSEDFVVNLSSPVNASISDSQGSVTITDLFDGPAISIDDDIVIEGDTATLTVSLSEATGQDVTVDFATADGSAVSGADYDPETGTLTIPAGSTSTTISVSTTSDLLQEGDENLFVNLSNPSSNAVIADGQGEVTIQDAFSPPAISIDDVTVTEGETATFTVSLSAATGQDVTVDFATADDTATVVGGDYDPESGTLTIPAGTTSVQVTVDSNSDLLQEDSETAFVNLSNPSSNATIADGQGLLTILDDFSGPTVSIDDVTVQEGNVATLTVSLSGATGQDVTMDFATADGTAVSGADYDPNTGQITIAAGSTSTTITVTTLGDNELEADENLFVNLSNLSGNASFADDQGQVTITDLFFPPAISIDDVTVTEGETATFTVSLSAATGQDVTVDFATADDTATVVGGDYDPESGTLTIPAGTTSVQVTVDSNSDLLQEDSETAFVNLSNPSSNATIADGQGLLTILDDFSGPTVSIDDVTVQEGNVATLTVSLSEATGQDVTMDFATADGTAVSGADYDPNTGQITIAAGSTSTTITVTTLSDNFDEPDENLFVNLSNLSGNAIFADAQGEITIQDSTPPVLNDIAGLTVDEANLPDGSSPSTPVTQSGTFSYSALVPVTILMGAENADPAALSELGVGDSINGEHGTLTIDSVSAPDADGTVVVGYTYELTSPEYHDELAPSSTESDGLPEDGQDVFQVRIQNSADPAELSPVKTLVAAIIDDEPTAANDTVSAIEDDNSVSIDALANDVMGADGAEVSHINGESLVIGQDGNSQLVDTVHGTVYWNSTTARFEYTPDEQYPSAGSSDDSFNYTLTDGDGDTDEATVDIEVEAMADTPQVSTFTVTNLVRNNNTTTIEIDEQVGDQVGDDVITGTPDFDYEETVTTVLDFGGTFANQTIDVELDAFISGSWNHDGNGNYFDDNWGVSVNGVPTAVFFYNDNVSQDGLFDTIDFGNGLTGYRYGEPENGQNGTFTYQHQPVISITLDANGQAELEFGAQTTQQSEFVVINGVAVGDLPDTFVFDIDLDAALGVDDFDSSETLSIEINNVPPGAFLSSSDFTVVPNGGDSWTVEVPPGAVSIAGSLQLSVNEGPGGELPSFDIELAVTSTEPNGSSETATSNIQVVDGAVVDGVVQGLSYETSSGLSGMTDATGGFVFQKGDTVTFSVGNVVLGTVVAAEVMADGKVFLQEIAGVGLEDLNDEYVENMAVFLQSLDSDGNADNGIVINEGIHTAFSDDNFDLATVTEGELASVLTDNGYTPVSEGEAMEHVKAMIEEHAGLTEFEEHVDDGVALLATAGDDVFAFSLNEETNATSITGFGESGEDALDLRDLLVGEEAEDADLTSYLNVTFDGADTVIEVSSAGEFSNGDTTGVAVNQTITLEGVDLVGSDELATVIQNMLESGQLITD